MEIKINKMDYHRNGCFGEGFYVVLFELKENREKHNMVAVVFKEKYQVAVLDIDLLAQDEIAFTVNSWRGDNIADELRPLMKRFDPEGYEFGY